MAWQVFEVSAATADELQKDDVVNRQSLTIKDGAAYGAKAAKVVLVEGSDAGIARAAELVKAQGGAPSPRAAEIHQAIKDEEAAAEGGVGFIFG